MGNTSSGLSQQPLQYRGRLAPSPTGHMHLGHARTFWTAQARTRNAGGALILRNEDLDPHRCKPGFVQDMLEDLRWLGLQWDEGPDCGGKFGPYNQSERLDHYHRALRQLQNTGCVYPCYCSRRDIFSAVSAPHPDDEEPVYPGTCRSAERKANRGTIGQPPAKNQRHPSWRFRVPDGDEIRFVDGCLGAQLFIAGCDFGDFVVWRPDNVPAYQLAVVVDDAAMKITEVVRGDDLLLSTARQLLLYAALALDPPAFYHCPLLKDHTGKRLAKRHTCLSLRSMRAQGVTPESLRDSWMDQGTHPTLLQPRHQA